MEKIIRKNVAWMGALVFLACCAAGVAEASMDASGHVRRDLDRFIRSRVASKSVSVEIPGLTNFTVNRSRFPGELRTELSTRAKEPLRGRVSITVALYAGDMLVKRSVVTPYVRVTEKVIVPTRDIPPGTVLSPGDLVSVERDAARLPKNVVRDAGVAVGMKTKRTLRKDEVFRENEVATIPIVERGDRVQLILSTGSLVIQSAGKAQQAGGLGDWIRVRNVDSKRELSGRVDGEGRVHVSF